MWKDHFHREINVVAAVKSLATGVPWQTSFFSHRSTLSKFVCSHRSLHGKLVLKVTGAPWKTTFRHNTDYGKLVLLAIKEPWQVGF